MFLAVSHNSGDPTPYLAEEAARFKQLQDTGIVNTVLLKADWSGVVLVLTVPDGATARAALDTLPLVSNGLTTFELTEVIVPPQEPLPAAAQ